MNIPIDPAILALSSGVAGSCCLLLGGFVLWRERASLEAASLFVFTLIAGAWLLTFSSVYLAGDPAAALARTRLAYLAVPLIPGACLLFSRVMVGSLHRSLGGVVAVWLGGLVFVGLALGTNQLLSGIWTYSWGMYPAYGSAGAPFLIFFGGVLAWILWELGRAWAREEPGNRRTRLAWLTVGFAIAFTGAVDFAPKYGIDVTPLGFASLLGFVVVGTWTVFRYPLVDVSSRFTADQVLETMADLLLVCDRDGKVRLANRAVEQVLGYPPERIQGRSIGILDGDDPDAPPLVEIVRGSEERDRELRLAAADGEVVDVNLSSSRIMTPRGRWVGTVLILRDVRERRRLEAQLHQVQKMEAIGRLAAGVAHDFNNIVTAIRGHTQLLLEDVDTGSPLHEDLRQIDGSALRAGNLTQQLLQFGRAQVGHPRVVDPAGVVRDMMGMLRRLLGGHVEVELDIDPEAGEVEVDPVHLEQILMNLVVNARDAMPQGGRLGVSVRSEQVTAERAAGTPGLEPGPHVSLSVRDTGEGMDDEVRRHIFEPFFTTKGMGKGTGLGLATVYGIVKQNGGHIGVDSWPGEGSRFTVWFPRVER